MDQTATQQRKNRPLKVGVLRTQKDAKIPVQATLGSAGFDLYTCEEVVLNPRSATVVDIGLRLRLPDSLWGKLYSRSSLSLKFLDVASGVIDSDYRGAIKVVMFNHSSEPMNLDMGQRFAQIVFHKRPKIEIEEVDDIPETETARGSGGFGSTGA